MRNEGFVHILIKICWLVLNWLTLLADEETDYHIDHKRTCSGTARTNRLYIVGRQLLYHGAARQDGAKDELDHIKKQRGGER